MIDQELTVSMSEKAIGIQASIHDCHETLEVETVISSGSAITYSNDKGEYEDKNESYNTWDADNDAIDTSNIVPYAKIDISLGGEMKAGTANALMIAELVIPSTPETIVEKTTFTIPDVGTYHDDKLTFHAYNGGYAQAYGMFIRLSAIGGSITIKNSRIKVGV